MKDIFSSEVMNEVIERINRLSPNQVPNWGKMNAGQMLAHCNVTYNMGFESEKFKKPGPFKKFLLKTFVRKIVVSEQPYKINSRTAPDFLIKDTRDFEKEKSLLIDNIKKVQNLGRDYFKNVDNISFGKMTGDEWNNMFYKHLDHHLRQFGV